MNAAIPAACILAAASKYQVPPAILYTLLEVEGGRVGTVSQNSNDTQDLGPMQINTIWVPQLARRYGIDQRATRENLIRNGCFNVDAGAWILSSRIREAGNFWRGVAHYHSRTPSRARIYLSKVLEHYPRYANGATGGAAAPAAPAAQPRRYPEPLIIKIDRPNGVRPLRTIEERMGLLNGDGTPARP